MEDRIIVHNRHHGPVPEGFEHVYVGRPSPLGNPFKVGPEFAQGEAMKAYLPWLREQCGKDTPAKREILRLAEQILQGHQIALVCSCAPKPCHAEHIKTAVVAYANLMSQVSDVVSTEVITYAATGHRPSKLGGWDNQQAFTRLCDLAKSFLRKAVQDNPTKKIRVTSGLAQGWDMAWAVAGLYLRNIEGLPIIVCAAIPFASQPDAWSRNPKVQRLWHQIVDACDEKHVLAENPRNRGEAAKLLNDRNRWLVEQATVMVALYNGDPKGGTANCVRDAEKAGIPVKNLWKSWVTHIGIQHADS